MKQPLQLFLFLMPLLASVSVAALADEPRELQAVTVDLDGDGVKDTVRLLSVGGENAILEIALTKSGRKLSYDKLVRDFKDDADTCRNMGENKLTAGKRSFQLYQRNRDQGACAGEDGKQSLVELVNGVLQVRAITTWSTCWSMGDACPGSFSTFDFARKTIKVTVQDAHMHYDHPTKSEAMERACKASLSLEELQATGVDECLRREAFYMADEIRGPDGGGDYGASNICPVLDGTYTCTWKDFTGEDRTEKLESIRRTEGKVFRYDVRGRDAVLIADGKARQPKYHDGRRDYEATTCRRDVIRWEQRLFMEPTGDWHPRPPYDRLSYQNSDTVWKQLDLEGRHFTVTSTQLNLQDDGTYKANEYAAKTMDCVKDSQE